jgi:hypothetical protein
VNVARADIVDRAALIEALKSGRLGGFALDPLYEAPGRSDDELLGFDNVVPVSACRGAAALQRTRRSRRHDGRPVEGAGVVSKAFRFHQHGGPEVLRFEDVEWAPRPRRGTHPQRRGRGQLSRRADAQGRACGEIAALRHRSRKRRRDRRGRARRERLSVGDRVAYAGMPEGSYAECRDRPGGARHRLPAGIDERTAASMMIRGMTARCLLHDAYKVSPATRS